MTRDPQRTTVSHYRSDWQHADFLLFDVLGCAKTYAAKPYADLELDREAVRSILTGVEKFAQTRLAPSFAAAERTPIRFDADSGRVSVPADLAQALRDHLASDWLWLDAPGRITGTYVPASLRWAMTEFVLGANPAVAMCTQVAPRAVGVLQRHGDEAQRRLAELVMERGWTVTMAFTEPDAGSDVGAARTKATRRPDGTWHIEGTKHFITWGEHDAAENIVHLVLARTSGGRDAEPGGKGLSLFVVPSHHYDPDTGIPGERNGVRAVGLEHKMGVVGTPTCELTFGAEENPAVGTMLGAENTGLRHMFEIITYVRMLVGLKAAAALSSGHLQAVEYAATRRQGRAIGARPGSPPVPIIEHPDVRRSLLTQKAYAEGARALTLYTATLLDRIEAAEVSGAVETYAEQRYRLLLPVVKGWCSESAWRVLGSESLQVFGGSGYMRDYPLEQYVRDTKIDTIYEGTTGIQALDLLQRRVLRDDGRALYRLFEDITRIAEKLEGSAELHAEGRILLTAVAAVGGMSDWTRRSKNEALVALGATRLLMALGDLVVGWLLLRAAAVAVDHMKTGRGDRARLAGIAAAGRWFARQVLPRLGSELVCMTLLDEEPLGLGLPGL